MTVHETCVHDGALFYRDRCPRPASHGARPGTRPAHPPPVGGVRRHLDPTRLRHTPGTIAGDRELALRTLMPRHERLPSWEDLTDSQRAEVTRVVEAFALVRQAFAAEQSNR